MTRGHDQRVRRLELAEQERWVYRFAERYAEELGVPVEGIVREYWELADRVQRWGMDAGLRWIAEENGVSEDAVRAEYEALRARVEEEP